jgi:hypothetical protein
LVGGFSEVRCRGEGSRHEDMRDCAARRQRGKARPPVAEAMQKGRKGKPHDEQARARMSEAHRRRGTRPPVGVPWTVRSMVPKEAEATGRTLQAVWARWRVLGLPDGRRK